MPDATTVVLTGVYGSGKSAVVEEMAAILEERGLAYAALDLDWLWWFDSDAVVGEARRDVLMANVGAVVANYRAVGVDRFLMAWAMRGSADLEALRQAVSMPVQVVRLAVPVEVIRQRLHASVVTERQRDALVAERWIAASVGSDVGDIEVENTRPVRAAALETLGWLGWV